MRIYPYSPHKNRTGLPGFHTFRGWCQQKPARQRGDDRARCGRCSRFSVAPEDVEGGVIQNGRKTRVIVGRFSRAFCSVWSSALGTASAVLAGLAGRVAAPIPAGLDGLGIAAMPESSQTTAAYPVRQHGQEMKGRR